MKLATLCYIRQNDQTLMLHRVKKANDMHQGKWNGLGGKLLPGESPEECAVREIEEESGLRVADPRLRGVLTFPAFDGFDDWYVYVFTAHDFSGQLIDSPEGNLAWIPDQRLLDLNLWAGDRIFIPWLDQERFFSAKFIYADGELVTHQVVFHGPPFPPSPEQTGQIQPPLAPASYRPIDDTYCWMCDSPIIKRHCKIVCQTCGFTRDCSDP